MTKLTAFWQALESVPGLVTTTPYWKLHCGSDYPAARLFLNATENHGGVHPCGNAKDQDCSRQVIEFGDDGFIAICLQEWEPCEELSLCADDTVLYELGLGSFIGTLSDWIGVSPQRLDRDKHGPWVMGRLPDGTGNDRTVFLIITSDLTGFIDAARKVVVHSEGRKVILAPTNRFIVDTEVLRFLQQHRIPAYSLEDLLLKREDGKVLSPKSLVDIISGKAVIRAGSAPNGTNGKGRGFAANVLHNRKVAAVIAEIGEGWMKKLPTVCWELHRVEAELPKYWRAQQVGTWVEVSDLVTPGKAANREKLSQQIRYCLRWVREHPDESS